MPHCTDPQTDGVLEFLCDRRFHRQFTYIRDNTRRRITFADYGDSASTSVVLFFGGLMGARFSYSPLDQLAKKHNVRIIHPDRPGVGGSDPVAIEDRISTYIDMVPHLLNHLGVQHVALAGHSFGTIYLLNTLLAYPQLLHPQQPYAAFFAPWVHPEHTGIRHLQAAEMLPAGVIGKFSSLAQFVNGSITPLAGASAGLSNILAKGIAASQSQSMAPEAQRLSGRRVHERSNETDLPIGIDLNDAGTIKELRNLIPTFLFAEGVDGAGQDAQLCLRKPRSIPWCTPPKHWNDLDDAVHQLENIISEESIRHEGGRVWHIDAFHAETDSMVGKKGQAWFNGCWNRDEAANLGPSGAVDYRSQTVKRSDHDFILDPIFGASEAWLKHVGETFTISAVDEQIGPKP
ncbi:hypothetical protein SVAN01_01302 [Stagonosporopsis vannaccii]|nr:hypothetical protein SVAN01_01302 [Stagonosporopsis vannaccii]